MNLITCECGQPVSAVLFDGRPRLRCPYCRRALPGRQAKEIPVAELVEAPPGEISAGGMPGPQTATLATKRPGGLHRDGTLTPNVYRDGKRIVAPREGAVFPKRCVKTNEPAAVGSERLEWIAMPLVFQLFVGLLIARAFFGESTQMMFGLSDGYRQRRQLLTTIGWGLVAGGGLGLLLFTILYVAAMAGGAKDPGDVVTAIPLVLGLAALAGLPVLVIGHLPILYVRKWNDRFLWLSGANREFVNLLPEWPSEHRV